MVVTSAMPLAAQKAPKWLIQDNSFLMEEAYNQEPRTVQHILGMMRGADHHWTGAFTEEWPMLGIEHQISYTLPLDASTAAAINYRYQLIGDGEAVVACAPRLSLTVGTRHDRTYGMQLLVPVSVVVSDRFATHWNAGATFAHGSATYVLGASAIWAARPRFHLLLENVWSSSDHSLVVSPGVRWGYDFKNGLQIVPGVVFPFDTRSREQSLFVYLSFEHLF
jgi:hypothetical protein